KTDPNNQTGILTLIVLSLMWGALLTWFNNQMRMPKSERPGWGKTIGYLALGLVLMFVFLGAMAFVPTTINPTLNAVGYFVAAVVAYGI
ncbi:membrane protein, partial [Vibrio vulnificus]